MNGKKMFLWPQLLRTGTDYLLWQCFIADSFAHSLAPASSPFPHSQWSFGYVLCSGLTAGESGRDYLYSGQAEIRDHQRLYPAPTEINRQAIIRQWSGCSSKQPVSS